jgi:hypothetical protein
MRCDLASVCRSRGSSAALFALFLLPLSCKRSEPSRPPAAPEPQIPVLGPVTVQDLTPDSTRPTGVSLDSKRLEARVRSALDAAGLFRVPKTDAGSPVVLARVRIEMMLEDVVVGDKGAARATLHVRIDTRPSEIADRRWNDDVQAGSEMQYARSAKVDRNALFEKLVNRTIDDLMAGYIARQKLWSGDAAFVRAAMTRDAGELRIEAIRAAGERKLTSEVPVLLALLDDPDESIRDAALGALVELREKRTVSVLASQRSMRDKREMRKILDAMALLGGAEAAEYLAFVADGHDDPEIRQMASEARRRLLRRQDAGAR